MCIRDRAVSPLTAAQIMLSIDRFLGGHFFDTQAGGAAVLWMHFFWIFGHPEVYVLIIPCFAFASEIIPVFSRKPIFGYPVMVGASCLLYTSPYTRAAELRAAYHVNDHWAIGVGIENSNQFIGNYVALPSQFSAIGSQFDNNANAGAANLMPDIIAKTTYDTALFGRHFHAELTGFLTGAHASVMPSGSALFNSHNAFGGGGQVATNYELIPNKLVVLANAFWSDGGAHYLVGTGPELVVRPLSLIHI